MSKEEPTTTGRIESFPRAPESGKRLIVPLQNEHDDDDDDAASTLEVTIGDASDSCFFAPLSGDVEEGGVLVATWRALPVGTEVTLAITLPAGGFRASGTVRFARDASDGAPPGLGVAWERLADEARAQVAAYCDEREPLYYDVG